MKLDKQTIEQLKQLLPDVEADFPTVKEIEAEAELSVMTSQVYINRTLMELLKAHEDRLADKMTLVSANIANGRYRTRYEFSSKKVKADIKAATEQALKQRESDIEQAKVKALDELIADHLTALQQEKEVKAKQEQEQLKQKLLEQLFS